jgi:hypothetical protein
MVPLIYFAGQDLFFSMHAALCSVIMSVNNKMVISTNGESMDSSFSIADCGRIITTDIFISPVFQV